METVEIGVLTDVNTSASNCMQFEQNHVDQIS